MWKIFSRQGIGYRWRQIDVADTCDEAEKKVKQLHPILKGDFRICRTMVGKEGMQRGGYKGHKQTRP